MSFLLKASRTIGSRPVVSRSMVAVPSRGFNSSRVLALKESDRHDPDQAANNEKHKQDSITKSKEGKGHWKPELASDSEEAVAADRHEHSDHSEEGIKELQKKTTEHAEKKHKHGTSQDPGM